MIPNHSISAATADPVSIFGHYRPQALLGRLILISQNLPHNWLGKQLGQVVRRIFLRWGSMPVDLAVETIRMRCHFRDNASERKFVFMPWCYDDRERRMLIEEMPRDGVFVDIGANVGIYSLTVAVHMNAGGRIIALEPNPPAFSRLCFNLESTRQGREDWPVIDALQVGIGETAGEIALHLDPRNLGSSSIVSSSGKNRSGMVLIPCKTLLSILDEQSVSAISALKIDIEGAEDIALFPFLQSASDQRLPKLIIIENSEKRWKHDLAAEFGKRGYVVTLRTRMNTVYRLQA